VFNPTLQGKKFDPLGVYVRRYVPELADVSNEFIHEPWKMPEDVQRRMGCVVGVDYPAPVVDHAAARLRALERYGQRKG
jgi:deoxyribodipyrimidine photo-lyase